MNDLAIQCAGEQARFLRPAGQTDLEALHATFIHHRFALHTHRMLTIALVERGAASFELGTRRHVAPAGSVFVIPPEAPHTGESATPGGYTYKVLYVEPERVTAKLDGRTGHPSRAHDVVLQSAGLAMTLGRVHRLLAADATGLAWEEALGVCLARLREVLGTGPPSKSSTQRHRAVARARDYLNDHVTERVYLDAVAVHAGISPYHLSRIFHAEMGMPLSAYQRQLRVELAKKELREGVPVVGVAANCGFSDQAHLTRHFKRAVGVSPRAFALAQ